MTNQDKPDPEQWEENVVNYEQETRNSSRLVTSSSSSRPWNHDDELLNDDDHPRNCPAGLKLPSDGTIPNRWSQYENEISQEEKDAATAQAVYHAATALAQRDFDSTIRNNRFNEDEMQQVETSAQAVFGPRSTSATSRYSSSDDDEYHRAIRDDDGDDSPSFHVDHEQIRQEALRMLEVADADRHYSVYKTISGGFTATAKPTAHRSALAGINLSSSERSRSGSSYLSSSRRNLGRPYRDDPSGRSSSSLGNDAQMVTDMEYGNSNNYNSGEDENESVVDVISMERRSLASRQLTSEYGGHTNSNSGSWSSRYSIDSTLLAMTGGTVSKSSVSSMRIHNDPYSTPNARILDRMDRENRAKVSTSIFGFLRRPWFTSKTNNDVDDTAPILFIPPSTRQPNLVYVDGDGRASSMPDANPRTKSWAEQRKKRCQTRILLIIAVALIVFIVSFSVLKHRQNVASVDGESDAAAAQVGESITFYVTSDIPFQVEDDKRLEEEIMAISEQAKFVVHLGNVQASPDCPSERYGQVADILHKYSPRTVFIVPGTNDWNACNDSDVAWEGWFNAFSLFNEKFEEPTRALNVEVYHLTDHLENWAFVESGVLFVGVHEVGGIVQDLDEFAERNDRNYRWVTSTAMEHIDEFRAIVIFGNFRPGTDQNTDFFAPLGLSLANELLVDKPVLYVHSASGGSNRTMGLHQPFKNVPTLSSFSPPIGSSNPPYRINVGFGEKPFIFG